MRLVTQVLVEDRYLPCHVAVEADLVVGVECLPDRLRVGKLDLDGVGPRCERVLPLPDGALAAVEPGKAVSVRYAFACREQDGYLAKGYVVANDQIDLPNAERAVPLKAPEGKVAYCKTGGKLSFEAGSAEIVFDLKTGVLASYKVNGEERLLMPMTLDAYRAPSSNEVEPAAFGIEGIAPPPVGRRDASVF